MRPYRLVPVLLALTGCERAAPEPVGPAPEPRLDVEVVARVDEAGAAAWTAQARFSHDDPPLRLLPVGVCRPLRPAEDAPPPGPTVEVVRTLGPLAAALSWDPLVGSWATFGPRSVVDPAWAVGALAWVEHGVETIVMDAIRFGPVPEIRSVEREPRGDVRLGWDPRTVDTVSVLASGPAGPVECGAGSGGVEVPWWSVPSLGGEVVVRSEREQWARVDGDHVVHVRAIIERVVPLDRLPESADRSFTEPGQPLLPRERPRSRRGPRPIRG
jgi:hypothetical protein